MRRIVRLMQNRWWRRFWLVYFAGSGSWDLVEGLWPFALAMALMMTVNVLLWMSIDRNVARLPRGNC